MGVNNEIHRRRVGMFYPTAIRRKQKLSVLDIIAFNLLASYGIQILPLVILLYLNPVMIDFSKLINCQTAKSRTSHSNDSTTIDIKTCTLNITFHCIVVAIMLIISGIEVNPGPVSGIQNDIVEDSSFDTSTGSDNSFLHNISQLLENSVSFMHLNIQSIKPKMDNITAEYSSLDILSFTESWLKPVDDNEELLIPDFKEPFRTDRQTRSGGGVIVYIRNNVNCVRRLDLEVNDIECVWLELRFKNYKVLDGTFYIPPSSSDAVWNNFSHSIELAINCNFNQLIMVGDFNDNQLNQSNLRMSNVLTQFSLHQLITTPTYFTEHSSTLLDLIITDNANGVVYSEVGPSLLDQVRYHCPTLGLLNIEKQSPKPFKRKVYLYDRGDYNAYREKLINVDWDVLFDNNDNDIDSLTSSITDVILNAAADTIPNKIVTIRKSDPPWITSYIRKNIRKKNRLHKKAKKSNTAYKWEKFRKQRNKCVDIIRTARDTYYNDLSDKIISEKPGSKNFWTLIKKT